MGVERVAEAAAGAELNFTLDLGWVNLDILQQAQPTWTPNNSTTPQHQPLAFFISTKKVLKLPQEMHLSASGP